MNYAYISTSVCISMYQFITRTCSAGVAATQLKKSKWSSFSISPIAEMIFLQETTEISRSLIMLYSRPRSKSQSSLRSNSRVSKILLSESGKPIWPSHKLKETLSDSNLVVCVCVASDGGEVVIDPFLDPFLAVFSLERRGGVSVLCSAIVAIVKDCSVSEQRAGSEVPVWQFCVWRLREVLREVEERINRLRQSSVDVDVDCSPRLLMLIVQTIPFHLYPSSEVRGSISHPDFC
jgi:hypothetical protein